MLMGGAASPNQESVSAAVLAKGRHLVRNEVVTMPDFGRGWQTLTTKVPGLPVRIRSIAHGCYLSSSPDGGVSHQKEAKEWEQFTLLHLGNGLVFFRTVHEQYLGAPDANADSSQYLLTKPVLREWEIFTLEHILDGRYALRTYHGTYVCLDKSYHGNPELRFVANRATWLRNGSSSTSRLGLSTRRIQLVKLAAMLRRCKPTIEPLATLLRIKPVASAGTTSGQRPHRLISCVVQKASIISHVPYSISGVGCPEKYEEELPGQDASTGFYT